MLRHPNPSLNSQPHFVAVGGVPGLCLQIGASGSKSWILRIRYDGRRHCIGLGSYPEVPLEGIRIISTGSGLDYLPDAAREIIGAREKATALRTAIKSGVDPIAERKMFRAFQRELAIAEKKNARIERIRARRRKAMERYNEKKLKQEMAAAELELRLMLG